MVPTRLVCCARAHHPHAPNNVFALSIPGGRSSRSRTIRMQRASCTDFQKRGTDYNVLRYYYNRNGRYRRRIGRVQTILSLIILLLYHRRHLYKILCDDNVYQNILLLWYRTLYNRVGTSVIQGVVFGKLPAVESHRYVQWYYY